MRRIALLLLLLLTIASCSVEVPSDIISPGKMERILYDYHQAQGMADAADGNVANNRYALIQQVFKKHGVTEAEFDSSMVWYSAHSEYLVKMYKHIDARLEKASAELGFDASSDVYSNLSSYGDTAVVWRNTNVCLRNNVGQNLVGYKIHTDSTFLLGDTYELRFRNRFVVQSGQSEGYALLVAHFDNDSIASVTTRVAGSFDVSIKIPQSELTDTAALSYLQVVFYYPYESADSATFMLWMVNNPMLVRFHRLEPLDGDEYEEENDTLRDALQDTLSSERKDERLTPRQLRESHEGERTINVTRQRDVIMPAKTNRRRGGARR